MASDLQQEREKETKEWGIPVRSADDKDKTGGAFIPRKKIYRVHDSMAVDCVTFPGGSSIFHCRIIRTGVISEYNGGSGKTDNSYITCGIDHPVFV